MKLHPRLTAEGAVLVKRAERLRTRAEPAPDGGWVIGYGHTASTREGATITEADADVLLIYDLSRSADAITPLLHETVTARQFDALNAAALRLGPDAIARSDVLRRINAGEALSPAEILAARVERPSALLAAADALKARIDKVLRLEPSADEVAHPRLSPTPVAPAVAALPVEHEPEPPPLLHPPAASPGAPVAAPPVDPRRARAPEDLDSTQYLPVFPPPGRREPAKTPAPAAAKVEPARPDFDPDATRKLSPFDHPDGTDRRPPPPPTRSRDQAGPLDAMPPSPAPRPAPPAPVVSFMEGGRRRLWDRYRDDPRVYAAVGACGAALFVCALLGFALGRPTGTGLLMGLVGILCLAVGAAFFLYRGLGGGAPPAA